MKRWGKSASRWLGTLAAGALVTTLGLTGCGTKKTPPTAAKNTATGAAQVAGADSASSRATSGDPASATPIVRDRLHQAFADATRSADNPPAEEPIPPDRTRTGKPTFKVLDEVKKSWDSIRFVDGNGKPIHYTAIIETDFGKVEMDLKPESAPNHVRSFIALAKAGYYEGLLFDRIVHQESSGSDGQAELKLDLVEAGCPMGVGEVASGSIGYWLKPEFTDTEKHEEGTVGASHAAEADTAATRFYITLDRASYLDGNYTVFGKIRKDGLDVVRKIAQQPVIVDEQERDGSRRPEKPIVIKKVTIQPDTGAQS